MNVPAGKRQPASRAWRADPGAVSIAVCRPHLPRADAVMPYIREIDESRWYSNHGPLHRRLEHRLAEHADVAPSQITLGANATAALTATLLALEPEPASICMMPAWTFAATGQAVLSAGLIPWFVDVEPDTGALSPIAARRLAAAAPGRLGAVLTVSPFGSPVDVLGWEAFRRDLRVPVVLDGAAAFDTVRGSMIPTVVSLHATKVIGIGEGAFVVWRDVNGLAAIRDRMNFGFHESREAQSRGLNAKVSEYSAAVGLAALDAWPVMRETYRRVAVEYREAFERCDEIRLQEGYGDAWVSATAIVRVPASRLEPIEDALMHAEIGSRRWWGDGLARHRAFARYPCAALPVTEALAASTLGLPCSPDLSAAAVRRVAETCVSACASQPSL
jgi:dTDP-4-amino-4,6-dideoxygalactose transaminase